MKREEDASQQLQQTETKGFLRQWVNILIVIVKLSPIFFQIQYITTVPTSRSNKEKDVSHVFGRMGVEDKPTKLLILQEDLYRREHLYSPIQKDQCSLSVSYMQGEENLKENLESLYQQYNSEKRRWESLKRKWQIKRFWELHLTCSK